jgi:hypothetical protein
MSSSIRPDEFSKYAPRWVREGTAKPRDAVALPPAPQLPSVHSADPVWRGPSPFEGDVRHWRTRAAPAQQITPDTPILVTGPVPLGIIEKMFRTAAVVVFAVIAMGALGLVLFPTAPKDAPQTRGQSVVAAAVMPQAAPVLQREKYTVVKTTSRVGVSDPRPMEPAPVPVVTATRAPDNAPVVLAPAPPPAPAPQVASAYAVASVNPAVQVPPQPQAAPPQPQPALPQPQAVAPPVQAPQTRPSQPRDATQDATPLVPQHVRSEHILAPDELDRLINRGEAFLAQGDVAAARLVLMRAAEARDPRAALALGSTYDPNALRQMGVVGVQPDPAQARAWYEKAAEFGSGDASQRLSALAQLTR